MSVADCRVLEYVLEGSEYLTEEILQRCSLCASVKQRGRIAGRRAKGSDRVTNKCRGAVCADTQKTVEEQVQQTRSKREGGTGGGQEGRT